MNIKLLNLLFLTLLLIRCSDASKTENLENNNDDVIKNTTEVIEEINDDKPVLDNLSTDTIITEVNNMEYDLADEIEKNKNESIINHSNTTEKDNSEPNEKEETTTANTIVETVKEEIAKPNHSVWNDLLKKNVSSTGKVNYKGLKNDKAKIEAYINQLTAFTSQTDWSRNEKLAFWINLYNALTVKLILDNYPVKSITDLYGGKPWDKKLVTIGTKSYTLNHIENDIIRPKFNDARIHFAVNCAAKSCPKLMNGAFLPEKLGYQLNKQTKTFVNGPKNNITANAITISKIFEWYKDDFKHGDVIAFLNQYSNTKINPNASISFDEYDWNLNE